MAAGLDVLELPAKTQLYDAVLAAFRGSTGTAPEYISWVPGRLEVFGTHTDYAGGRTLIAAVPRGFAVAARGRVDGQLCVSDAACGESVTIDPAATPHLSGWRHYVEVVGARLARNFPGARLGADIVFASDLPRAAGMSSSSALMVGVAAALARLSGIRERPEWRGNIAGRTDEAGYYACIENGRSFGALAGDAGVGTHGGSEDHAAMLCGEPRTLSAYAFVPMRSIEKIRLPERWSLVVVSSGVAAEKTGRVLASYNRLSQGAAILLDLWNRSNEPARSLGAALAADRAQLRLEAMVQTAQVEGWTSGALADRLQQFIREDARIPAAIRAIRAEDGRALNELARTSQLDSVFLLRNQVEETVQLARLGLQSGALATRSFGAGFGGSVWALVERQSAPAFLERWLDAYRRDWPTATRAVGFVAPPGPPLTEIAL